MKVVGSLTLRYLRRQTLADGRHLPPGETTEYLQADRKREEHRGFFGYCLRSNGRTIYRPTPRTALIKRGDLQKTFLVNFDDREYATWPLQVFPTLEQLRAGGAAARQSPDPAAPNLLIETETVDTGERKELFGRLARHVITTRREIALMGSSRAGETQTITDGWYIDLDTSVSCEPSWWSSRSGHAFLRGSVNPGSAAPRGDPPDRPTFKDIGEPERGYALISRSTHDGWVSELEVTHLSTEPTDPALFQVPATFRLVEEIRQEPVPPFVIRVKQAYERLRYRRGPKRQW